MKRLLALVFSLTFSLAALAQVPQPPEVAARSYLLLDVTSNQIPVSYTHLTLPTNREV